MIKDISVTAWPAHTDRRPRQPLFSSSALPFLSLRHGAARIYPIVRRSTKTTRKVVRQIQQQQQQRDRGSQASARHLNRPRLCKRKRKLHCDLQKVDRQTTMYNEWGPNSVYRIDCKRSQLVTGHRARNYRCVLSLLAKRRSPRDRRRLRPRHH